MKHIVILGGGYGGLLSALTARKRLTKEEAAITVVNQFPTHQIITELHRLATGNLSERAVGLPLDKLLKGKQINLLIDKVTAIHADKKQIILEQDNKPLSYDLLVIALGSQTSFFQIPGLEQHSLTLKSVKEANHVRSHILEKLDQYKLTRQPQDAAIVVGGGGLTGVELVGELADRMPAWCKERGIPPQEISLYCVEAAPNILPGFETALVDRARSSLTARGATFITGMHIAEYTGEIVRLRDGREIPASTLVWTGGVKGNECVAESGIALERGRAQITPQLASVSHPDIFVAGDSAVYRNELDQPTPPSAQLACQMGEAIGYNLYATIRGLPLENFRFKNSGKLVSLGRKDAIASVGANNIPLKGLPASLMKEGSKARYLAHINGLSAYIY